MRIFQKKLGELGRKVSSSEARRNRCFWRGEACLHPRNSFIIRNAFEKQNRDE